MSENECPTSEPMESQPTLDEIIAELNREHTGILPEQAIRAAQQRREEITPRLIELIRQATETVRAGNDLSGNGQLIALFLLTEFRAKEALPTILDAVSLPDEGPFELFGDAITEDLARILAELFGDRLEILEGLIANRSLNDYVRWKGAQTYLYLVGDGRMTREEAVEHLRRQLVDAIVNRDEIAVSGLIAELVSYAPREAIEEIREAYRKELVDEGYVGWNTVEKSIAEGKSSLQRELRFRRSSRIVDTVQELRSWTAYSGTRDDTEDEYDEVMGEIFENQFRLLDERYQRLKDAQTMPHHDEWPEDEWSSEEITVRNKVARVGRNDPCLCGSGKKHKKCCGKK